MRIAFKMKIKEGNKEDYIQRHNPIWAELESILFENGVKTYSIFLDEETNNLFAYAEVDNLEKWNSIANTDVCRKWWDYMAPLMSVNEDNSPKSVELNEIFHISK